MDKFRYPQSLEDARARLTEIEMILRVSKVSNRIIIRDYATEVANLTGWMHGYLMALKEGGRRHINE